MSKVFAIAINTFREAVRNRILYIILIFAILMLVFSGVLKNFTISDDQRMIQNFGMAAINLFGVLIAIFIGITLIYNELEKKTIYTIVSKPIDRSHFLLGKYFGLLLTIYVNVLIMTLFFLIALHWQEMTSFDAMQNYLWVGDGKGGLSLRMPVSVFYIWTAIRAVAFGVATFLGLYTPAFAAGIMATTWMTCLELAIITAFACMYSSFSTPTLSAFFTVFTVVCGRLSVELYYFAVMLAQKAGGYEKLLPGQKTWYNVSIGAFHVIPNLGLFNRREAVIYPETGWDMIPYTIAYAVAYSAAVLCLSILIFRRRNFK
ncbi:MAG: ABC transporter permease [Candidatus Sumerlaeota bacterium]|nr:ABC transporter permease [Candidatus Sumerlaeota bacterium]